MITCPICGVANDPSNRFCDQCGARLDTVRAGGGAASGDAPAAPTITCPNCGSPALPGQAFCDNCGHDLCDISESSAPAPETPTQIASPPASPSGEGTVVVSPPDASEPPVWPEPETPDPPAPPVQPDTETMLAPPPEPSSPPPPPEGEEPPQPEQPAQPDTETMLAPPPPPSSPPEQEGKAAPVWPDTETVTAPPSPPPAPAPSVPIAEEEDEDIPSIPMPLPEKKDASSVQPDSETMLSQPTPEPEPEPTSPDAETSYAPPPVPTEEDIRKLKEEVERHRATVSQMEQMLNSYPPGAPTPEFLNQGLEGARRALAQAETRLAGSSGAPSKPEPDPAEVARVEELIRVHSETIAQFERMKSSYPPDAAPVFLDDGIREARRALTKAETELAVLKGEVAPPSPAPAPAPSRPVPRKPKETDNLSEPAKGPRLEMFDGKHVFLFPKDKTDIVVGREDPVSYIFPEVDLTSVGGEAGGVSRQHARMTHAGGQWTVTDLNSTNHTRVNGERIEPENPVPIEDGTRLQFGRIVAIFRL